jgi:hypothetical protein
MRNLFKTMWQCDLIFKDNEGRRERFQDNDGDVVPEDNPSSTTSLGGKPAKS